MNTSLIINQTEEVQVINKTDIIYCQASDGYCEIYTKESKRIMITKTLTKIAEQLDDRFIRVSQSAIVNKLYIGKILKKEKIIVLTCNGEVPFTIKISDLICWLGKDEIIS